MRHEALCPVCQRPRTQGAAGRRCLHCQPRTFGIPLFVKVLVVLAFVAMTAGAAGVFTLGWCPCASTTTHRLSPHMPDDLREPKEQPPPKDTPERGS